MQKSNSPKSESERIALLKSYQILDTPPEKLYDNIALLASQICDAPIALISLVDSDRVWFKAKFGLDISESPREGSLCDHVILQNGIFQVSNAATDLRFKKSSIFNCGSGFVFYAGAPLKAPSGDQIGALCVLD